MVAWNDALLLGGNVVAALLGAGMGGFVTYKTQKKGWEEEAALRKTEWGRKAAEREQDQQDAAAMKEAQDRASLMLAVFHLIEVDDFLRKKSRAVMLANASYDRGQRPVLVGDEGYWQHLPPDPAVPVPTRLARDVLVVMAVRKLHELSNRMADADSMYFSATTLWRDYGEAKRSFAEQVAHLMKPDGSLSCRKNDPALQPAMASIVRMANYADMIRRTMERDAAYVEETLRMLASSLGGIGGPVVELSFLKATGDAT